MEKLLWKDHLGILAWIIFVAGFRADHVYSEGVQCGRPGRPVNGTISPAGKVYFPGEKVTYSCLEGFVLFGEEGRTCLKNGTWSADVPLCDFNLARGKRTLQSETLWSYAPDLAVDGNRDTCSFTPKGPDPRWWQVHLGHKFNVVAIGVTISPGSFQQFTIFVIELLADNKALYKPCTTFKGVFQTHKGLFKCNDGLGHPGQFVYIRDDRTQDEYFGLCEVEVFAFRERIPCGDPEVPVNGEMLREGEEKALHTCDTGFKLEGDAVLMCSSKGKWQGQMPRCKEMKCTSPPPIDNGFIEIGGPRGEYVYGTESKYGCSPGHVLRGSPVRVCNEHGEWTGEAPTCHAVTCGDPPVFPNAKYSLLNGSNQWTGIAVFTCVDGYKLHPEQLETVTTCLDIGKWRTINVTCVPIQSMDYVGRQTLGRSLNYEVKESKESEDTKTYLVIALAVIAGVLAAGMIVFGVLLIRRRYLSGPGSLSPLVRPSDKPGPFMQTINKYQNQGKSNCATNLPHFIEEQPSQFHSNLLQSVAQRDSNNHANFNDRSSVISANGVEPPYEHVRSRSEHSYETLGKKSGANFCEGRLGSQDTNYDCVSNGKESVGYETVAAPKEPNYEIVKGGKDPGYEVVRDKDHQYETVNAKDPGYETVKEPQDPGYEVVKENRKALHSYETLKPKLPPRDTEKAIVPDILQNLNKDDEENLTAACESENFKNVSPEILALYARVDKSRKKKTKSDDSYPQVPQNHPALTETKSQTLPSPENLYQKISKLPNGAKDLIRKFNSLNLDEEPPRSLSPQASIRSEISSINCGTLRPLPPLPHDP